MVDERGDELDLGPAQGGFRLDEIKIAGQTCWNLMFAGSIWPRACWICCS
jgi:hypothetical protein